MRRPTLYLVDGSSYVYRAFFALPPLTSPSGVPTNAVYGFTTMLLKLLKDLKPSLLSIVFDAPGGTFRDEMYADYKANRPEAPADLSAQWPLIHEVTGAFRVRTLTIRGVEADDVIGTLARTADAAGMECVVVTSDKDLMQLVGPHVRLWDTMRDKWTDTAAVRTKLGVDPEHVPDVFGLVGDAIDNIPGVKGIGEKTATALMQRFGSLEGILAHLDDVASSDLRGAKKIAGLLREHADLARLSRDLATVRRDLAIDVEPSDLRYEGPDPDAVRSLFQKLGFQSLARDLPAAPPAAAPELPAVKTAGEAAKLAEQCRAAGRMALACVASGAAMSSPCAGLVAAADADPPQLVENAVTGKFGAVLASPDVLKLGHNIKADAIWLARQGTPLAGPLFDTMVASYMLGATTTHALDDVAREIVGENIAPWRVSESTAAEIGSGVALLDRLRAALAPRLRESGMETLFGDVEMPLVHVLAAMERRGVRLDATALREMGEEWRGRLNTLTEEIYELAGGEFNIGSPPQLREVLFERLGLSTRGVKRGKTGLSTDVDVLTRLAAEHPLPAKILEHRALAKLLSTYVDSLLSAVNPETGRLHTVFNQTVAATGRLSSSDPNLQNIPIRGDEGRRIRSVFIPADGCMFVAADYSQIELRVMAHLAEDPSLVTAFQAGDDIHAQTAATIFGVLPGTVTSDMRRAAKVINFGIMYGMGPQRLAGELGIPLGEAQAYIRQYFDRYRGVRAFIDRTVAEGREKGYVSTMFGRRRLVPELQSRDRATAQAAERAAINMPIQGTAADLIKIAMVRTARRLEREGLRAGMILQVHDELVLEAPESELERTRNIVREEMEQAAELRVPLRVDVGTGRSWAEAH